MYAYVAVDRRRSVTRLSRNGFKGIASALQEQIESGSVEPGRYLPTERELQEQFGASRSTIRRALARLVEMGWAKNVPSKGVIVGDGSRRSTGNTIAIIDQQSFVLRVLYVKISHLLEERGFTVVHRIARPDYSMEEVLGQCIEQGVAGALIWPNRGFADAKTMAPTLSSLPTVILDHTVRGMQSDLVTFRYFDACRDLTRHLAHSGRRRIAVSGMLDMLGTTHDRFSGYMAGLFESSLMPDALNYLFCQTSCMPASRTELLEARLRMPDRPDAILVLQDEFVPDVVEAVNRCGLRVPQDVALAAIGDDIDVEIDGLGLTAVALDWETLAQEAVRLLIERIQDPSRPFRTVFAPHRIVVHGSCGSSPEFWTPDSSRVSGFRGVLPYPKQRYRFQSASASPADSSSQRKQHQ